MLDRQDASTFRALVRAYPPAVAEVAQAARQYILDLMPGAYEIVWPVMKVAGYGTGPKKLSEHYAWIAPYEKHVVLGLYYGAELPDPLSLLEGTGAKMRHIKLRTADDLRKPGVEQLLVAASKHRVPPLRDDAEADLAAARKAPEVLRKGWRPPSVEARDVAARRLGHDYFDCGDAPRFGVRDGGRR